jgi:uncharacterized metal-binding protein
LSASECGQLASGSAVAVALARQAKLLISAAAVAARNAFAR